MNRIQLTYPRGHREYVDIYGNVENMTVQDVLDKINNRSGDKAPFKKYFNFGNHHRFLDSDKCKSFLELYLDRTEAIKSKNPLPRDMLIRDIPGINMRDTRNQIWFNLDRDQCTRYLTDLQMAQKRRSLAVASMLPQNVQQNIMSQLDVDTVGEIGSRMRPSGKITKKLGLGRVPVELQDYDMDQNYDEFVEQRRRREQLRRQREELQRERDEDLKQYGGGLEDDEILNKLNDINVKLDLCCGNYDKATKDIQRVYRGHTSRRDTRRTMRPNITESLFTMPKEVGDRINELIPETRRQIKEQERLERERQMPQSSLIVPDEGPYFKSQFAKLSDMSADPSGSFSGQPLHNAMLQLLNDDPNYDIESWVMRIFTAASAAESILGNQRIMGVSSSANKRSRRYSKHRPLAVDFARRFKIWYDNYYLPKKGGKRKKKKTRKKKR